MSKRRFVLRTIKNGQVKIFGRIFKPSNRWLKYDGRLDGQRWAFGLYWRGDVMLGMVGLWGTEEAYVAAYEDEAWTEYCETHSFSPDMVFDPEMRSWHYPWATWYTEVAEACEKTAECQPIISI